MDRHEQDRPSRAAVTELELLQRWGHGDPVAGSELLKRYVDPLSRFFQRRIGEGRDDLVQETLLACVEARERFRGDASFRTFVFQTARFQLYAHLRKRSRRREIDAATFDVQGAPASPSALLARRQEQQSLLEALRRIPLPYQIVLELRLWEDLSGREMATLLRIPEPTLRSRLRLAAECLRKELPQAASTARGAAEPPDFDEWARKVRAAVT